MPSYIGLFLFHDATSIPRLCEERETERERQRERDRERERERERERSLYDILDTFLGLISMPISVKYNSFTLNLSWIECERAT